MFLFQKELENAKQFFQIYKRKANIISVIRFFLMSASLLGLLVGYFQEFDFLYIIAGLCFLTFMVLVMYHDHLKKQCDYYQSLSDVCLQHVMRHEGKWKNFDVDGYEFIDDQKELSDDLDLFGKNSLFQMMNIAFTKRGKRKFANALIHPENSRDDLMLIQESVQELSLMKDFVICIETYGKMISCTYENRIDDFIEDDINSNYHKKRLHLYILPVMTLLSLFLAIFKIGLPYSYIICEIGFVSQLCLSFLMLRKHSHMFSPIQNFEKGLESYLSIFKEIEKTKFQTVFLKQLKASLFKENNVIGGIQQLSRISQRVSYRQNIFAFLLLNGFLSFDLLVEHQYNFWLNEYRIYVNHWFDQLAQLEMLMSLSVLKMDEFDVVMPKVSTQSDLELSFRQLRHPLIQKDTVVGNDFEIQKKVTIITGSNMSGKTTFMRTVALNLVLAYAGSYVFANKMTCSFMHIMTSMRVKDNVDEGISTFYGELLRIREMVDYTKQKLPMICFIDEIFKGTNSLDRIAGAKATIQKLSLPFCFTFLTTHDFELCQIDNVECQNYHFDEYYQDEHIYFDYQIKFGQSESTNGQFLLKQLGIMEEE